MFFIPSFSIVKEIIRKQAQSEYRTDFTKRSGKITELILLQARKKK